MALDTGEMRLSPFRGCRDNYETVNNGFHPQTWIFNRIARAQLLREQLNKLRNNRRGTQQDQEDRRNCPVSGFRPSSHRRFHKHLDTRLRHSGRRNCLGRYLGSLITLRTHTPPAISMTSRLRLSPGLRSLIVGNVRQNRNYITHPLENRFLRNFGGPCISTLPRALFSPVPQMFHVKHRFPLPVCVARRPIAIGGVPSYIQPHPPVPQPLPQPAEKGWRPVPRNPRAMFPCTTRFSSTEPIAPAAGDLISMFDR